VGGYAAVEEVGGYAAVEEVGGTAFITASVILGDRV
jgi:hypothetical protein